MPWKTRDLRALKTELVRLVLIPEANKRELMRRYKIKIRSRLNNPQAPFPGTTPLLLELASSGCPVVASILAGDRDVGIRSLPYKYPCDLHLSLSGRPQRRRSSVGNGLVSLLQPFDR